MKAPTENPCAQVSLGVGSAAVGCAEGRSGSSELPLAVLQGEIFPFLAA